MALVVILYAAYGIATKREYDRQMRILSALLTAALDLTVLLGFATIFAGTFYPQLGGHIVMMVLATAVAHVVHGVMKRRPDDQRSFAPHLVGTAIVLGMVVAGIMAIGRPVVG
jgi:diacylglycerol kinase